MKYRALTALACFAFSAPAFAQEEEASSPITVTGSVGLITDYRFRGVSQTDKEMAIQGGITVTHESGFYAGTWGSNLAGWGTFGGSSMELDLFAGYAADLGGATVDVGLTWFMYPGGADTTDFAEPYVKVSSTFGPVKVLGGVAYAPKQKALGRVYVGSADYATGTPTYPGAKDDNLYLWGDLSAAVPQTPLSLRAHLGHSNGNSGLGPNGTSVAPTGKYWDWNLGADVAVGPVTLGVTYVDTSISKSDYAYIGDNLISTKNGSSIAGSTVLFSVTASF
jgi:uncharacterized protein (TIGR02001 family)